MNKSAFPLLVQVNTRVYLTDLSHKLNRKTTLDDIPDSEIDKLAESGFDWIWFLSVWQTGKVGKEVSRQNPEWRKEFNETLPDLEDKDIAGSGFAITSYTISEKLGGEATLLRLRDRLRKKGMKLMLDFVPNHTAIDHPWVLSNTDFYIKASESDLEKAPANFTKVKLESEEIILAHGRDPFFPGWPDTLQLNYGNALLQETMIGELVKIARLCDGVRCDMAMLIIPEVFEKTWGIPCNSFWPQAISKVRDKYPDFCFVAEVYWDMEWTLLQQGFDYTYDKRLYDRLKEGHPKPLRDHLFAALDYQSKMARFLENHDEQRVAAEFPVEKHKAAAVITFLIPGLRFFHHGQYIGKKLRISPHLVRAPLETINEELETFYNKLFNILRNPALRNGNWVLLDCTPEWEGNSTNESYISFAWQGERKEKILVVVNYSSFRSQCFIKLPFHDLNDDTWLLKDYFTGVAFKREGKDLQERGMYLDEPAWKIYVFELNIWKE